MPFAIQMYDYATETHLTTFEYFYVEFWIRTKYLDSFGNEFDGLNNIGTER
jgi:hypothetical protein